MRGFKVTRICTAAFALLVNAALTLFLTLDYTRFSPEVHPEVYHRPVLLSLLGPAALAVLLITVTGVVDICRRHNPAAVTQVRFELAWLGTVIFLQYSAALVFTTLYLLAFKCDAARDPAACRTINLATLAAAWGIPFVTFCYFIFFLVVSSLAAKHDSSVWRTPVLAVDWDGTMSRFDDTRSIATFVNNEEVLTMKTNTLSMPPKPFLLDTKTRRSSATKSVGSVYSTDTFVPGDSSPLARPPAAAPSPTTAALGRVRYFQATTGP